MKFTFDSWSSAIDQVSRAFDELKQAIIKPSSCACWKTVATGTMEIPNASSATVFAFTPSANFLYLCIPRALEDTSGNAITAEIQYNVSGTAGAQVVISNADAVDAHAVRWILVGVSA